MGKTSHTLRDLKLTDLNKWLEEVAKPEFSWYVKRLSGNDTLANGSHQAGPYIPREWLLGNFSSLNRPDEENPREQIGLFIDSHGTHCQPRIIWYNNKFHGGTRNEIRMTGLRGAESPLLDPENTGALTFFAFESNDSGVIESCRVWVCKSEVEEDQIESRIGPVEPGERRIFKYDEVLRQNIEIRDIQARSSCWLAPEDIPHKWYDEFPSGQEVIDKAIEINSHDDQDPDGRIVARRACETEIFFSLEEATAPEKIQEGFSDVKEFLAMAQSMLQRRKSRAGNSFELHTRTIFLEEGLVEGVDFEYKPRTELSKQPDFLFPSGECYMDPGFPADKLTILALKTTCKDRWRQVLAEAKRIERKYLLTLQEGISENQFRQMQEANVQLVTPASYISKYSKNIQPHLQTLTDFIKEVSTR